MSSTSNFYEKYNEIKDIDSKEFHNKLADYLEQIIHKKSGCPAKLFNDEIAKELFQPKDYCRIAENRKEVIYRMLYIFLSQNKLQDAMSCLIYLIRNFYPNMCYVWRAGFHILRQHNSKEQMDSFFRTLMTIVIRDKGNMIYEYFLYLVSVQDYERVRDIFNEPLFHIKIVSHSEHVTQSENEMVTIMIKMTVAVACYSIWKTSLSNHSESEDYNAADQSELYFRELIVLINKGEMVDNYIANYLDLLESRHKYTEALQILKLYQEKCPTNFNAKRFLLRFMIEHEDELSEVSGMDISECRLNYIVQMMPINPHGDLFTAQMVRKCVEERIGSEEYETAAEILFELLENVVWLNTSWPFEQLVRCIEVLGVDSELVQEKWIVRRRYWPSMYFQGGGNEHTRKLALFLT